MGEGEGDAGGELGRHDGRRLRLKLKLWTARESSHHSTANTANTSARLGREKLIFNSIQLQPGEREADIQLSELFPSKITGGETVGVLALPVPSAWRPSDITKFPIPTTFHPTTPQTNITTMTSLAAGLNKILPSPRYNTEETAPTRGSGARILGGGDADQAQLVLKVSSWTPPSNSSNQLSHSPALHRKTPLLPTEIAHHGVPAPQTTSLMVAPSPKSRSPNIPSTWAERATRRRQKPSRSRLTPRVKSNMTPSRARDMAIIASCTRRSRT